MKTTGLISLLWIKVKGYLREEEGQTSTEYILLLAVVAFIIFKFKSVIAGKLFGEDGNSGLLGAIFSQDNISKLSNVE